MKKTTVLMILDGLGLNVRTDANAFYTAKTPNIDYLMKTYPFVQGRASGLDVGLPDGQMGNSEVGHTNIGAGRIVYQELTRITKEIEEGSFFENPRLVAACENCKKKGTSLHLLGLLSDGGVHSHNTHLYGLLELAKRQGVEKVYVHCFMDGRDTSPTGGVDYVKELQDKMEEIGVGQVATVTGRYYAMDRDRRWQRTQKAYDALTQGVGKKVTCPICGIRESYEAGVTDEFIEPIICVDDDGNPLTTVQDGDSIIFFNFRPDRARQLTRAFCDDEFVGFEREQLKDLTYVCFTEYDPTIPNKTVAFEKQKLVNTFGEYMAKQGKTQLRLAETEKYPHVTFFFNGGVEPPNEGEDRILVQSPKDVPTYDYKPEMSAVEVCDNLVEGIKSGKYDAIIVNFANPDMVGHTGVFDAVVKAVETVDTCVGRVLEALQSVHGQMFVCADHGNSEQMINYETGEPFTAHTTNPVPFILVDYDPAYTLKEGGRLCDIIPTMLDMMGMEKPAEMTGVSLLKKK